MSLRIAFLIRAHGEGAAYAAPSNAVVTELRGVPRNRQRVERRETSELVERVVRHVVRDDVDAVVEQVRHHRNDLFHQLLVELRPALEPLVTRLQGGALVDLGVTEEHLAEGYGASYARALEEFRVR